MPSQNDFFTDKKDSRSENSLFNAKNHAFFSASLESDGHVYIRCDLLNIKLYSINDNWILDHKNSSSSIIYQNVKQKECEDKFVFKLIDSETDEEMSEENTEKRDHFPDARKVNLNNNYSITLRQIRKGEYISRMLGSAHLRHPPYKEIIDIAEAQKMLEGRFKTEDFRYGIKYEIIFKDKTKIITDGEAGFIAYYPEVEVLLFEGGHVTDYPLDLNDGTMKHVGNPRYHVLSPDRQLRLNGYYDGQDCEVRFLEKWNDSKKRYDIISFLTYSFRLREEDRNITPIYLLDDNDPDAVNKGNENPGVNFCHVEGLFWTSPRKVLFKDILSTHFYEMEVIERGSNESSP